MKSMVGVELIHMVNVFKRDITCLDAVNEKFLDEIVDSSIQTLHILVLLFSRHCFSELGIKLYLYWLPGHLSLNKHLILIVRVLNAVKLHLQLVPLSLLLYLEMLILQKVMRMQCVRVWIMHFVLTYVLLLKLHVLMSTFGSETYVLIRLHYHLRCLR